MFPWGHLAFGYLWYSLATRILWKEPPLGRPTLVLALSTQLPDLVDKPLAWTFHLYPTGYGAAHSVLVAGPVVLALTALAVRRDHAKGGAAFALGYFSHFVGDLLPPLVLGLGLDTAVSRLLWPVVTLPGYRSHYGFVRRVLLYVGRFVHELAQPEHLVLASLYLAGLLCVVALWLSDGAPGVRELVRSLTKRDPAHPSSNRE